MPRACLLCKENDAVMHRFPNYKKCPERFKIWVSLCGGKLETEADYEYYMDKRICDKHFTSKDHNRNNRLNAMAVPSLFLTAASAETQVLKNQPIHAVTTESQVAAHLSIIEGQSGTESKTTESEPAEIPMLPKIISKLFYTAGVKPLTGYLREK